MVAVISESVAFEWPSHKQGGVVRYTYPADKRPDTNSDMLSLGFITPSFDAVLARVDSHSDGNGGGASDNGDEEGGDASGGHDNRDFLELQIVSAMHLKH